MSFCRNLNPRSRQLEFPRRRPYVWRWPISSHERLEELCFLAAAGEIQEAEWKLVKAHLAECASCRNSFSDLGTIHSACFPQAARFEVERAANEEGRLRNSILRAATREGAQFSPHVKPQIHENRQAIGISSFRMVR